MKRVYLLGDSIRLGYQPFVTAALEGRAVVDGPPANCESSRVLRSRLSAWVSDRPDIVHVNCGLHDVRYDPGAEQPCVDIAEYGANVEAILKDLEALGIGRIVWASTTPVDDSRNGKRPSRRWNVDIDRYNAVARKIAGSCGAAYNDLHVAVRSQGTTGLLRDDGVHFTQLGYEFLASRVVDALAQGIVTDRGPDVLRHDEA
jgi:isoamyl acetate esterase